jgi:hypothetical protein
MSASADEEAGASEGDAKLPDDLVGGETPHDIAHADKPQVARPIRVITVVMTVFGLYD